MTTVNVYRSSFSELTKSMIRMREMQPYWESHTFIKLNGRVEHGSISDEKDAIDRVAKLIGEMAKTFNIGVVVFGTDRLYDYSRGHGETLWKAKEDSMKVEGREELDVVVCDFSPGLQDSYLREAVSRIDMFAAGALCGRKGISRLYIPTGILDTNMVLRDMASQNMAFVALRNFSMNGEEIQFSGLIDDDIGDVMKDYKLVGSFQADRKDVMRTREKAGDFSLGR